MGETVPDEDEFLEVDLTEFEEADGTVDEELVVSPLDPRDPSYLVVSGRVDPAVDDMVNRLFGEDVGPTDEQDDRPTDRPPPPADDPDDDAAFRAFMESAYGKPKSP